MFVVTDTVCPTQTVATFGLLTADGATGSATTSTEAEFPTALQPEPVVFRIRLNHRVPVAAPAFDETPNVAVVSLENDQPDGILPERLFQGPAELVAICQMGFCVPVPPDRLEVNVTEPP